MFSITRALGMYPGSLRGPRSTARRDAPRLLNISELALQWRRALYISIEPGMRPGEKKVRKRYPLCLLAHTMSLAVQSSWHSRTAHGDGRRLSGMSIFLTNSQPHRTSHLRILLHLWLLAGETVPADQPYAYIKTARPQFFPAFFFFSMDNTHRHLPCFTAANFKASTPPQLSSPPITPTRSPTITRILPLSMFLHNTVPHGESLTTTIPLTSVAVDSRPFRRTNDHHFSGGSCPIMHIMSRHLRRSTSQNQVLF